ncbi:Protein of unknown function [Ekhidna lutea]|uniref:DUF3995 domain-containing protein n=1 Tax=Ekhidna lutea TaxID=447679 RepID=A0A239JDV5_EKHLU|nr:DUF3995 domain-containing protein [Ekhidna lutea]SNT04081.1 Protein of unknown function [Ekhidna lutea]
MFLILLILSGIHISWALGSEWSFRSVIPTNENDEPVLNPTRKDSALVGIGLLFFAVFYLIKIDLLILEIPSWAINIASWMIPSIFLFRAIGDFRYVGFFKKITKTPFAKKDALVYSPLCLGLAIIGFIIELT